jgi:hypothetical protein
MGLQICFGKAFESSTSTLVSMCVFFACAS